MKRFCIITNSDKGENKQMVHHIIRFLENKDCYCTVMENKLWLAGNIRHFTDVTKIEDDTDCIIVLGGDGTMIQAAIDLVHKNIPIIGVNTGTLGFLTEVEQNYIDAALQRLMDDDYVIESRIMLKECRKFYQPDSSSSCYALNDMVISKRGSCRLITVKVFVNGNLADIYRADGLIISTPTGSTGYNLSAGGPVMAPNLHAMVVTPICAHSLNKRSLVLDGSDTITLEIGQTKEAGKDLAMLIADGRNVGELSTGDVLEIKVPNADTKIIKLFGIDFYEKMREKLNGEV